MHWITKWQTNYANKKRGQLYPTLLLQFSGVTEGHFCKSIFVLQNCTRQQVLLLGVFMKTAHKNPVRKRENEV